MSFFKAIATFGLVLGLFAGVYQTPVKAADYYNTCNGQTVRWRSKINFHRNVCTIFDGSWQATAYWNSVGLWNYQASQLVDGFFVRPISDCSVTLGDDTSEVGLADRESIDGYGGLTTMRYTNGKCLPGDNKSLFAADIRIANDLDFTHPDPWNNYKGLGQEVFVHEFGHAFGIIHPPNTKHSVMRAALPGPRTGNPYPITLWPDDINTITYLYGENGSLPNLVASPWYINSSQLPDEIQLGERVVCRNSIVAGLRLYVGNNSEANWSTFELRVRMGTNPVGSTVDVVNSFVPFNVGAYGQAEVTVPAFWVPNALPNGRYYLMMDIDPRNLAEEWNESDNSIVSFTTLKIISC